MALGVEHRDVRRMFLRHGLMLSAIGVMVGVVVAAGLMRLMTSVLYRVSPLDMPTYVGVSAVLLVSAMVASYLPARRAAALDPVEALRAE
jgi:ABC-type antimicrobial peptide transport system permease subunit